MVSPLRVGIIGTGAFAALHAQALHTSKDAVFAGCTDIQKEKSVAFAKQFGAHSFASVDDLLQDSMDILTVTSPDETHAPLLTQILAHSESPKLVIVEKPLCVSRAELQELQQLQQGHSTKIVTDHTRRFTTAFEKARAALDAGELGTTLLSGHFWYYGGWMHLGVHFVDTLRMLLGELQCADASLQCVDRYPEDPLLAVTLTPSAHPKAQIVLEGIPEHPYKIFEGELLFDKGRMRILWSDVFLDIAVEDTYSPALFPQKKFADNGITESLQTLYTLSSNYVRNGNTEVLSRSGFATASGTMNILFDARERAGL